MGDSEIRLRRATSPPQTRHGMFGLFVFVLVACGCAPKLGARSLPPLPREVTVDVVEENYDVTGRTVEEIRRSLSSNVSSPLDPGTRAGHRWNIRYSYLYRQGIASCEIVSVPIEITSRIILPRWTQRDGADPELVAIWDEYITALRDHEFTHREIAYLTARDFSRDLRRLRTPLCGTIQTVVRTTGQQIMERYQERNRVFDQESRGTINWPPRPSG